MSGDATVWRKQRNIQILTSNCDNFKDPRKECLVKLACEIEQHREKGSNILELDANDTIESKKDSYGEFADQLDLFPVIDAKNAVPSRFNGKRIIDHIETYQILPQHLKRRGQHRMT